MITTLIAALMASATPQPAIPQPAIQLAQGYGAPPQGYGEQMQGGQMQGGPMQGGQMQGGPQGYDSPQQGDDDRPPSPQEMAQQFHQMGYSAAGIRILQAANAQQGQGGAMQQRGEAVQQELQAAVTANPIDPARVSRALQAADALNAQTAAMRTRETATILGQLSPADRRIFAQGLMGSGDDQGGPDGPGGPDDRGGPPPQGGPQGY